jgi:hypothetical protein
VSECAIQDREVLLGDPDQVGPGQLLGKGPPVEDLEIDAVHRPQLVD